MGVEANRLEHQSVPEVTAWRGNSPPFFQEIIVAKVISKLTSEEIDTYSEAWRHECECMSLLKNHPAKSQKHLWLYGVPDRSMVVVRDKGAERLADNWKKLIAVPRPPIAALRGLQAADRILADAKRLHELAKAGAFQQE